MASSYAIDFGTSNTVVARWNSVTEQKETLKLPSFSTKWTGLPPLVPSLIYVEDARLGSVLCGQEVRDRGLDLHQDVRCFRNFKRGIGLPISGFQPKLDGQLVSLDQTGQWFLKAIIRKLQSCAPELETLILTVPVDSFDAYRHWLTQLCQVLEIPHIKMVDEPTAAALGYHLDHQDIILVVDFGGGTLDLSLVQLSRENTTGQSLQWGEQNRTELSFPHKARVIAKVAQNLGGADIDYWLADYFAATRGFQVTPLAVRLSERLKIQLSQHAKATEVYFDDQSLESYELEIKRSEFNQILDQHHFFEIFNTATAQLLHQAKREGLTVADIHAMPVVGGTGKIPAVQDQLCQNFSSDRIYTHQPFEAIAHGALQLSQGVQLQDHLYHGYGIHYWDWQRQCHGWQPLIPVGQPYPMTEPVEIILGASSEHQQHLELYLGELGSNQINTAIYFEGDRLITKTLPQDHTPVKILQTRHPQIPLDPLGYPGQDRIRLLCWIDGNRMLRATVEDRISKKILIENEALGQIR